MSLTARPIFLIKNLLFSNNNLAVLYVDVLPVLKHRDSNTYCYRVEVSHVKAEAFLLL